MVSAAVSSRTWAAACSLPPRDRRFNGAWRSPAEDHLRRDARNRRTRGVVIYCADYKCNHSIAVMADRWADDVRLSDIEPRFTCTAAKAPIAA